MGPHKHDTMVGMGVRCGGMFDELSVHNVSEPDATAVLREAWGIDASLGQPHHGISRRTWQAGSVGWLARESASRLNETQSEARLLSLLSETADFAVPTPIPTVQAQLIAVVGNYAWTLCRHIEGERLDDEPSTYRRLVEILAVIHHRLQDLNPHDSVMRESLLSRAQAALQDAPDALTPTGRAATEWLRGRIAVLYGLPPQIIHGDFGIPNVLVGVNDPTSFGILDWELSSYDSPIFDLAQVAFGMIAFSRAQPHRSQLRVLSRWYAAGGGQTFSEGQLAVALVAGRLANIARLNGRLAHGEAALTASVSFLDERLGRVLQWLGQYP